MTCTLQQDFYNCSVILDDIEKFYFASYKPVEINYNESTNLITDIFTDINWIPLDFSSMSIQTDKTEDLYTTAIKITITEVTDELNLFVANKKRFMILFIDNNGNVFVDSVIAGDNSYFISDIKTELGDDISAIGFQLNKTSKYNIKQLDSMYIDFNQIQ